MGKILVHIAVSNGKIKRSSLEVMACAVDLAKNGGHQVEAIVLDAEPEQYAASIETHGASVVHAIKISSTSGHLASRDVALLGGAIPRIDPFLVLFATTESVKDILGPLAVATGSVAVPDVTSIELVEGGIEARRLVMATKFVERVRALGSRVLVSVRSGSYLPQEAPESAEVHVVELDWQGDDGGAQLTDVVTAISETVDLAEAQVVVSGGRGVKDPAGKALLEELAGLFDGAIGASRAVVENGLFPATAQIGQTGKVVSPDLYFAVGISGAIQHVAGMTNSRIIVAVNKDPDAPIFDYASFGIVGDLYTILPALITEIRNRKAAS